MEAKTTELATLGQRGLLKREIAAGGLQYLTFSLAGEEYGVDILKVQEIRGWAPVTKVPNAPVFVRGVMNLRGAIVPVIDLRLRFNLETVEYTKTTVVIVATVQSANGSRIIGTVVDGVSDVLNLNAADIQPAPDFGTAVHTDFISGLVTVDSGMVMLLDVDRLLSVEEMFALEHVRPADSHITAAAA
ncbi:MAG: purine-binding chemotaxis protein CheW [Candidatus Competibacter sp.]|nr:purine-binding chemotaxis protein CheW [Candidatus Competibacter sp.]